MTPEILAQIRKIVGMDYVFTEKEDLFCYTYDGSFVLDRPKLPGVVVMPGNTEETSRIMKLAHTYGIPVVPRGAGSNLSGGSLSEQACIVMQMTRMNRILNMDRRNMTAVVESGVITGTFQEEVAKMGLFYPPDPSSLAFSTMGGNVAECAGGPRGVKYGVTRDYVLGLEVVLADGSVIKTGSATMKCVAGYDLTKLFTGSEGTLGVVTQITVKLLPMPQARQTVLASFSNLDQTAETVVEILSRGIIPSALELMDQVYIQNIESFMPSGLPLDAEAVLLIEVDGPKSSLDEQISEIAKICRNQGAMHIRCASSQEEREKLWAARRGAYGAIARNYPTIISEDVTVPRDKIPEAVRRVRKIAETFQLTIAIIAHAGDGNFHASILTDEKNSTEMARIQQALPELFKAALELGGTITGEHGVGLTKAPYLPWETGAGGMHVMKAIKDALDPKNILNPGKMFGNRSWS
ncbi:FAD-binding oxidoreductase [Candidatus Formimonas warabiya]|uniref:Glycolate oxidase subunit GlcD n=1 Tax=Formimonas warabiya TaxID=1761012 RepID=A0A3G1KYM6_FORW1|nr:FAD-linked oxidase C-terminal domain-containing protein [Candidatus Formimonas warabiya]ATW27487.1 glycolate oxidase subunit GlcD [Candidatus Formimonas warabiya]